MIQEKEQTYTKEEDSLPDLRSRRWELIDEDDMSEVLKWLLKNGFQKYYGVGDFHCVMRIHAIHYLFWSENLKHFFISCHNETGKKMAAGRFERWNSMIIPKPIYTIEQAKKLIEAIL